METLKEFLASCVEFDEPKENTLKTAASQLYDECIKWDKRNKSLPAKFTEALQGLPSYINNPFMNWEIIQLMYALGYEFNKENEEDTDKIIEIYWNECGKILASEFNTTVWAV